MASLLSQLVGWDSQEATMLCAQCARSTLAEPCSHCGGPPRLGGRYKLEAVLGRGTSGTTWRATGPDKEQVAIKSIPLEAEAGPKALELVDREVRVLRELEHPGIPSYVEHLLLGQAPNAVVWLVQELIPGRSLAEELHDHRYSPREVLAIVDELAGILDYLHELAPPVIHRDIKPGNVMRRPDGSLVLIDFGSVRDVAKGSVGGSTVAGTFGYMAPEQFAGDAEPRSDLYGLGALAVALLTRKEPQSLSDHANRLRWAEHTKVPAGVHDLVNRLVDPDLERRAPSAAWVQQRAATMLAAGELEQLVRRPSADVDRLLEPKPRDLRWWLLAGGLLVTAALVALPLLVRGAGWLLPRRGSEPVVTLPSAPVGAEPRQEQPAVPRPSTGAEAPTVDPLQLIVTTIGEDAGIQACVAQHQRANQGEAIQLEVSLAPPDEVTDVSVGPPSLADSALARCLEQAALRIALRGVALERAGSVTLEFD